MSVSQTVHPVSYCINLVYIHYHGSTSCIHHYIDCHKMKNKQYDTVKTDPKSHSKIVERVKIDTHST